jgi:hypothetical protein
MDTSEALTTCNSATCGLLRSFAFSRRSPEDHASDVPENGCPSSGLWGIASEGTSLDRKLEHTMHLAQVRNRR